MISENSRVMLQIDKLRSGYGESQIISDLSIDLRQSESLAVIAKNGMGKTTLFKTIMGLIKPSSGFIRLNGMDITNTRTFERARLGIGYVPQGRLLFSELTVRENLQTGLETRRARNIPDLVFELFPVLSEMMNRKAGNLSGGQQQMVAIGRALATEPTLLILDEPTEGLQPSVIKEIAQALLQLKMKSQCTVLVSEQVLSFATAIADRMVVIERGAVVFESGKEARDIEAVKGFLTV